MPCSHALLHGLEKMGVYRWEPGAAYFYFQLSRARKQGMHTARRERVVPADEDESTG